MKRQNSKGLKIVPNKRSKAGGFIVTGYISEKDESGKLKRIRKTFSGANAMELAQAFRNSVESKDFKRKKRQIEGYRQTKIDQSLEAVVLSLVTDIRNADNDEKTESGELLKQAVRFYLDSPYRGAINISLDQVRERYLKRDNFINKSKKHKEAFESTTKRFCSYHGEREVSSITIPEIEDFVNLPRRSGNPPSIATKRLEICHLRALFEYAKKQTFVRVNVATGVERPELQEREPVSLTIEQCKNLLLYAHEVNDAELLPYFVLAIFCAMRPYEVRRAHWEDIRWDKNLIRVRQEKGGGFTRNVEIPEICHKWFDHIDAKNKTGTIVPSSTFPSKRFSIIRAASGFRISEGNYKSCAKFGLDELVKGSGDKNRPEWINDVCRHTGISFRYEVDTDIGSVAKWAGNSPEEIERSYKSVAGVDADSTKEFYALTPKKVLDLN